MDSYSRPLVLIGLGNVGSKVLEQLIVDDHRYDPIVLADSKHVVPGMSSKQDLLKVLNAKRNGGLGSLNLKLVPLEYLPNYFVPGSIVINASPTEFSASDQQAVEKNASIQYDIWALKMMSHVVAAHKSAFANNSMYQRIREMEHVYGATYVPAGAIMGPTRAAEMLDWLNGKNVKVVSAQGIVNSTTNYILSQMMAGRSYEDALGETKRGGLAETNHSNDTQGHDALVKMKAAAMISGRYSGEELFGLSDQRSAVPSDLRTKINSNGTLGIEGVTNGLLNELSLRGLIIKLVGSYDGNTGIASVGPVALPLDNALAQVNGADNILVLNLEGRVEIIQMVRALFESFTMLERKYPHIQKYLINTNYNVMPRGHQPESFNTSITHNSATNTLEIRGVGGGSADTAAGLLAAANNLSKSLARREPDLASTISF